MAKIASLYAAILFLLVAGPLAAQCSSSVSGSNVSISCGAAPETVSFTVVSGNVAHNRFTAGDPGFESNSDLNSSSAGVQTLANGAGNAITVDTGGGNDTVTVDAGVVLGTGTINLGAGDDVLQVMDAGAPRLLNVNATTVTGFPFTFTYTATEAITLNCGTGADSIQIAGLPIGTTLTVNANDGNDAFSVGSPGNNSDGILGPLMLRGDGGTNNTLIVIDTADTSNNSYVISANQIQRNGVAMGFSSIAQYVINAGSGNDSFTGSVNSQFAQWLGNGGSDTFTLREAATGSSAGLNGGTGDDIIFVGGATNGMGGILGGATITGGANNDQLRFDDSATSSATSFTISSTTVTRSSVSIGFGTVETLLVDTGTGNDTVTVPATGTGTTTTVNSGAGNDGFTVGNGTLDGVLGPVTINGGSGNNTFAVNDSSETAPTNVLVTNAAITRTSGTFTALAPCRAVDTTGSPLSDGESRTFDIVGAVNMTAQGGPGGGCGVPTNATAVAVNITAVNSTGAGNLKAWRTDGTSPAASTLNFQKLSPNLNIANGVILPVRQDIDGDDITINVSKGTGTIVDITGFFTEIIVTPISHSGMTGGGRVLEGISGDLSTFDIPAIRFPIDVDTGGGNDSVDVRSNSAPIAVNGQGGNDSVRITGNDGTLGGIGGTVGIDGGTGTNTVLVSDAGATTGTTATVGGTSVAAGGTTITTFASVSNVTVAFGDGGDTVNLDPTGLDLDLFLGDGADYLQPTSSSSMPIGGDVDGGSGIWVDILNMIIFEINLNINLGAGTATGFNSATGFEGVTGGSGNDALTGSNGNNVIGGGPGNDAIDGGSGTDTLNETGDANFVLTNTSLTGLGTDSLAGIEQFNLTGGASNNTFAVTNFTRNASVNGLGGNDTITVTGGVTFTPTMALLAGGGTINLLNIESATATGSAGNDVLDASTFTGPVVLDGGAGDDQLTGSPFDDLLRAGDGSDGVDGGGGNDTLEIRTGTGNDNLIITPRLNGGTFESTLPVTFTITFTRVEQMNVNSGAGDDSVRVTPFPSTGISLAGGLPTASDSLNIDADCLGLTLTASTASTPGSALVTFAEFESVSGINAVTLQATSLLVPGGGSFAQISVTADPPCSWTATTASPFLTIVPGSESGTGNGTVYVQVQPNPTPDPRTGTVTITGLTFTISQPAGLLEAPATTPMALAVLAALLAITGALLIRR